MSQILNGKNQILTIACMAGTIWLTAALTSIVVFLIATQNGHVPHLPPEGTATYVTFGVLAAFIWLPRRHIVMDLIKSVHVWLMAYALASLVHLLFGDLIHEKGLGLNAGLIGVCLSSLAFTATAYWQFRKNSVTTFFERLCEAISEALTD